MSAGRHNERNGVYINCHTAFSFKYGTLTVEQLIREARRCKVKKLALTEINNTASYIEALRICQDELPIVDGVPARDCLVLGVEFRQDDELLYIALAENNTGFENINRFLSHHNNTGKPILPKAPEFENVFIIYPLGKAEPEMLRHHEYIGVRRSQLTKLDRQPGHRDFPDKYVILHPVTFANKAGYNTHRLLRAIHHNTLLSKLPEHQQSATDEFMLPVEDLEAAFSGHPSLIRNTCALLDRCSIDFTLGTDKNKKNLMGSESDDWDFLTTRAWEGFRDRYDAANPVLRERFQRELDIIHLKDFCSYYLITHDLVSYARKKHFDYVGRGSGANSIIAYCLGITNVDPIELDLYFERFLNPERSSPPDFDIDFSWKDRDAIYEYLFERHGKDHTCLLGTHVTYQGRSTIRELAKVFGLPKTEIDEIVDEPLRYQNKDHITQLIFRYAERLYELPANLSIHAGGVLITDRPIYAYTATDLPPKGYPVSHFEMHNAEDLGIYKFDVLSQRGLGHIKDTAQLIRQNRGISVDVHRFNDFKKDERVKTLLRDSKAMGCFYVESPAMRMLLGKLRCEDYLTLVAASSIIRPGVARSGMMRAYIERFHLVQEGKSYESIHPKMDELMKETYGVMVYQEDVIKVAHHFAGLTLSEADVLRRGMSGKFRSRKEFDRIHDKFFSNCRERGYDPKVVDRVWYEIESFSGYSFSKGHSASYAVESYQSLWLKAHYPLEFMTGVINNFGGFYRTEFYFHEARMSGGIIEAPCVNHSEHTTTLCNDHIYIGFIHLKSLETKIAELIAIERQKGGPYKSLDNFLRRIDAGLEQIRILIRVGAFRFTGKSKQRLLWEAMLSFSERKSRPGVTDLFDTEPKEYPLPELQRPPIEDAFDEIELLGFPLCDPFTLLETENRGNAMAWDLMKKIGRRVEMIGYVVTTKNTSTKDGQPMHFGTFYDAAGDVFDTVHFPNVTRKYPFRGRGFYLIRGTVVEDFGIAAVEVTFMDKLPMKHKKEMTELDLS